MLTQSEFLSVVARMLEEIVARQPQVAAEGGAVEFPSASLDVNGHPRFMISLPVALARNDLGAASLLYDDVAGRGFEFALRRFLDVHLASDDVFIDVGAHFGIHSLTAATVLPGLVSVLAIEPHPVNCALLRRWVEANGLAGDVEVVPKAIGDREGMLPLSLSASSMGHSLRTGNREPGAETIGVAVTTLDALVATRPHLQWRRVFLKIDVEGCELEALEGARNLFATGNVAAVIWEKASFHDAAIQARRDDAIFEFLDSRRFEHFRMEDETLGGCLVPFDDRHAVCNVYSLAHGFARMERYG